MCCAIYFYDEFHVPAGEIGNIRPDGHLACELESSDVAVFQALPKDTFGARRGTSAISALDVFQLSEGRACSTPSQLNVETNHPAPHLTSPRIALLAGRGAAGVSA
jgi:hypothetical protein